jgi:hypothetical protein
LFVRGQPHNPARKAGQTLDGAGGRLPAEHHGSAPQRRGVGCPGALGITPARSDMNWGKT